jgi:hypothetical protein
MSRWSNVSENPQLVHPDIPPARSGVVVGRGTFHHQGNGQGKEQRSSEKVCSQTVRLKAVMEMLDHNGMVAVPKVLRWGRLIADRRPQRVRPVGEQVLIKSFQELKFFPGASTLISRLGFRIPLE